MFILMTVAQINCQHLLNAQAINEQEGFVKLKLGDVTITNETDIILHLINPTEIIELVKNVSSNSAYLESEHRILLNEEVESILHKIRTLMPMNNRKKRGLINIVGTAQKWLFGTMDDEDRQMITQHVDEIRQNNRNAINVINKQVKINDYFNNTFQILKETIINDRETILKQVSSIQKIERRLILKQIYFDQLFKLKYINARVEHIQENIVSARNNILHPSILTNEEIETYKIDFF